MTACATCQGTGGVWQHHGPGLDEPMGCDDCEGTGVAPSTVPCPLCGPVVHTGADDEDHCPCRYTIEGEFLENAMCPCPCHDDHRATL